MNVARSCFTASLFLLALGSGCGLSGALDEAFGAPSTDGPFEIEVQTADGVAPSQVRAGLSDVRDAGQTLGPDGTPEPIHANTDMLVPVNGKAKLINQPTDVDTVAFHPIAVVEPEADGRLLVGLPEAVEDDAGYALVVWVDADVDGALTLSTVDGESEFARAPSRAFSDRTMALYSIWPVDPEARDDADGLYHAAAADRQDDADGDPVYSDNWIADHELSGWTVELSAPSM